MIATPIIPGRIYHVRGCGIDCDVFAKHGAEAILTGLGMTSIEQGEVK